MSTTTVSLNDIAAQWRAARRIYPIYALIVRNSDLGLQPCRELECPIDRNDPDMLAGIAAWFDKVDEHSGPEHLRNAMQAAHIGKEESLRAMLRRFLDKSKKTGADRDKLDFLLVQYFGQCAPHTMHNHELDLDDVSQVLEPVLGETVPHQPRWLDVLDDELRVLGECKSIGELLDKKVMVNVRRLKEEAGEKYFDAGALLAFTRFNFVARHTFLKLLHADLTAMRHGLEEVKKRGTGTLDCSSAGLSKTESLETLHRICHDWKTPFHAPYAAGAPFKQMAALLSIVQKAATAALPKVEPPAQPKPQPKPESKPEVAKAVPVPTQATKPAAQPVTNPAPPARAAQPVSKPAPPAKAAKPAEKPNEASIHEIRFETVQGKIPTEIMEAVKQANQQGPSTKEIPVYAADVTPAPAATFTAPDIQACLEHIAEQLIGHVQPVPTAVATILYHQSKILLSSWEVAAYTKGGNDAADALQRAVAARAILLECVERKKKGIAVPDLTAVLKLAHAEVGLTQEAIAQAKDAKNIDGAVNLAATSKRLMGLIDEAEKLAK